LADTNPYDELPTLSVETYSGIVVDVVEEVIVPVVVVLVVYAASAAKVGSLFTVLVIMTGS